VMKIRFCGKNEGSAIVCKRLRAEYPELNIKRKECVKNCGVCSSSLFALVDGNPVRGRNSEELYRQLVVLLKAV